MSANTTNSHIWPLEYISHGWFIMPLHYATKEGICSCEQGPSCPAGITGKHPMSRLVPNGKDDATRDATTVIDWWNREPLANIGIVSGVNSNLVIMDIDPRNGGSDSIQRLQNEHQSLPTTLTARSGGNGDHLYFSYPKGITVIPVSHIQGYAGIDLRADRKDGKASAGYVVAPPSVHKSGNTYDWVNWGAPLLEFPIWLLELLVTLNRSPTKDDVPDIHKHFLGQRHNHLVSFACKHWQAGASQDALSALVIAEDKAMNVPPIADESEKEVADIASYASSFKPMQFDYTDIGNGKRLAYTHGSVLCFAHTLGTWYIWNGRCWAPDQTGMIYQLAKSVQKDIKIAVGQFKDNSELEDATKQWARLTGSMHAIENMIKAASTEYDLVITPNQLDMDNFILPCNNGVLNLITRKLQPHDATKLYTKLSNADYVEDVAHPKWSKFVEDITNGNKELQVYLQKCAGYTLTGDTSAKVLFFLYGPPDTGKSTFIEAVKSVLGPYCATADIVSFLRSKNQSPNQHRTDLARLARTRLVCVSEIRQDQQLDESIIKRITGDDTITARNAYSVSSLEYVPTFKIWFAANDKPKVRAADEGFWSRLRLIPFLHQVSGSAIDRNLKTLFRTDHKMQSAILSWMVEGCILWQKEGLHTPAIVMQGVEDYRNEMDATREWLIANYEVYSDEAHHKEEFFIPINVLWNGYAEFLKDRGLLRNVEIPTTQISLSKYLEHKIGLTKRTTINMSRGFYGLKAKES